MRIYADGVFDLFHYGHARMLEQIKRAFPDCHLIVGVCTDEDVVAHKRYPILTHAERCESLRHCRWVDEVYPTAPWVITADFLEQMEIDLIAHDPDVYPTPDTTDAYAVPKSLGKFWATQRTEGVSTTDLIERVSSASAMSTQTP